MQLRVLLIAAVMIGLRWETCLAQGGPTPNPEPVTTQPDSEFEDSADSPLDRETLTDNWFGFGDKVGERGLNFALGLSQVYQQNVHGGLSSHRRAGRYSGRYDLEVEIDLEELAHVPGGRIYSYAAGGWSDGIDETSVGSLFGVNYVVVGNRSFDLWELYYEQAFLHGKARLRIGKVDLTGGFECRGCPVGFDGNSYANDDTSQFLNSALNNNPTIPFPDPGLGVMAYVEPIDGWYVSAAVADAQADFRETGIRTTFHGRADFFSMCETGFLPRLPSAKGPLQGAYRLGLWHDPQPKERFDESGIKRDDTGAYASWEQMVWKEHADEDDTQGLGLFGRYGFADSSVNDIKSFWSLGMQYQGLLHDRDNDVLGFGVAQGRLSRQAGYTSAQETAFECYYNIAVAPWLHVSPSVQYISSPGGDASVNDAVVVGVRVYIAF